MNDHEREETILVWLEVVGFLLRKKENQDETKTSRAEQAPSMWRQTGVLSKQVWSNTTYLQWKGKETRGKGTGFLGGGEEQVRTHGLTSMALV